ncbi:MAG: hypothetical protein M1837_005569 [Sclerophora amabilis]|nr:MAG: hypothetical protein M1837_005569 [Sclerophora amabilis]
MAPFSAKPEDPNAPVIPFDLVDAPTQRLYAVAIYIGLNAWRFYDYFKLIQDDADSLWLFLKWAAIDGVFIYGLPGMKIPWMEWSNVTITVLFLLHAFVDGILMFRIPIPIEAWLVASARIVYDRELAVSERRVNPANILRNSSHILGKHIIHILPEGSAMLNPDKQPLCLDSSQSSALLPIRINQTNPISIELLRIDLDTNQNDTISISAKQIRALKKQAEKSLPKHDTTSPRYLQLPVKRAGLYRLQKVVDESKLEVQRRLSDTLVVACPRASVAVADLNKCKGELSNLIIEVYGTPPLKIKYSRTINRMDSGFFFQSIQPENLVSPLMGQRTSGALVTLADIDVSWARLHHIKVPLNESLGTSGDWRYLIDEVHDACGNVANYTQRNDDGEPVTSKGNHLEQIFNVRERPIARVPSHDSQCSLKVARGKSKTFPITIESQGRGRVDPPYQLSYKFTPIADLPSSGEHVPGAKIEHVDVRDLRHEPAIQLPGLYSLKTISSEYCPGEVMEPSSCLLENSPEPDLSISFEPITDHCAGNSVGLQVGLDLIGTPPFKLFYDIHRKGSKAVIQKIEDIGNLRHQLQLRPEEAGHYTYRFRNLVDDIYGSHSLASKNLVLEQDVKPPASAQFVEQKPFTTACIEKHAEFDVRLQGESPWRLEYALIHRGKRTTSEIANITNEIYTLKTDRLENGGEYGLALVSVRDKSGCKILLDQEARIDVRPTKPKASFGLLEGKREALTLEGRKIDLPIKLTGQSPWYVSYRRSGSTTGTTMAALLHKNDKLEVEQDGIYELVAVDDHFCEGAVDDNAREFEVKWIPRPKISIAESGVVERAQEKYVKKEVCEEDEDAIEVNFKGTPPYNVKYEQRLHSQKGSKSLSNKEFTAGLGVASIRMETAQAGLMEYKFSELGDYLYDHDPRKHESLVIQQRVNPRPTAGFAVPGKTYKYCKEQDVGDEVIPIALQGIPPFYLEIGIKHHSSIRPEVVRIPNIETNNYDFRVPSRVLALGNHVVSIRKVRDAPGCQRKWDFDGPHVPVAVADAPSISPLDSRDDFCVGDRISYLLSGTQPFNIFYTFEGMDRKATSSSTNFRRIAEKPGNFTITAVTDRHSDCKARTEITKIIHELPSVRVSKGRTLEVDIHEGGEAEILFEFWGSPPFEFTYTRSTTARKGKKPQVLETKSEVSHEHTKFVRTSEEGTYEVIAIKDQFCAFSTHKAQGGRDKQSSQKLLQL